MHDHDVNAVPGRVELARLPLLSGGTAVEQARLYGGRLLRAATRRMTAIFVLLVLGVLVAGPAFAATTDCAPATIQGTAPADYPTYCWFDLSDYDNGDAHSAAGQDFVVNLPGGPATLSFNLKVTGDALISKFVPTWTGGAFGNSAFEGIPGEPVLYNANQGGIATASLSNITLSANGSSNLPFAFVAADGESSNGGESLVFTTDGNPWTLLAEIEYGTAYPTLQGVGTNTVTVTGVDGSVGSHAFASTGSPGTVTAKLVGTGLQGALFGVKFASADLAISKSHSGVFTAGDTGSYNIVVSNNGTNTTSGTTTVTDVLPTGLSYNSFSGSGWNCSATGQNVTCTNSTPIADSATLPTLTLIVDVSDPAPTSVENTATVSNPMFDYDAGNNSSTDPTTIIDATPPVSGNKILYLYDNLEMTRTPQTANTTTAVDIGEDGDFADWRMTPAVPAGRTLVLSAQDAIAHLVVEATGSSQGSNREVEVQLRTNSGAIPGADTDTINLDDGPNDYSFNLEIPQITLVAGDYLVLRVINNADSPWWDNNNRRIAVHQMTSGDGRSTVSFDTPTVINVDSVATYSAAHPAMTTQTSYVAGDTVFVRAVISDPFGAFDVNRADITLTDPDGTVVVNVDAMTEVGTATPASKTFEYSYTLPSGAEAGTWVASVTGHEGTEGTVSHSGNTSFRVNGPPLTIVKLSTVYSDPINGTSNPKAIPGALVTYQIIVTSPPGTQADTDSLIISDPIPVNTVLFVADLPDYVGSTPVVFNPNSSTLTLNFNTLSDLTDDVDFSSDGGATWTYVPMADANGVDAAVTDIRLKPKGSFAPGNFSIRFRVRVE